ncbi:hypothetical protein [Brevibacillus sp. IT-7CA2]|uniref:hypothetical protein n=1 Tax=Brevibacillus sp. IT-7CA2 TaxID=3026436 RepID=UPI0039E162F8
MPAGGIHWPSPLQKGNRRAKATLRAEVSQGSSVRQAGPLFEVPTGQALSRSTSSVLFLLTSFIGSFETF